MAKQCVHLQASGAIAEAILRTTGNFDLNASEHAAEYHNYGRCMGVDCHMWVGDAETGSCGLVRNDKQSQSLLKTIYSLADSIRFVGEILRAKL